MPRSKGIVERVFGVKERYHYLFSLVGGAIYNITNVLLFITWVVRGTPKYPGQKNRNPEVADIFLVGANEFPTYYIIWSTIVSILFVLTIICVHDVVYREHLIHNVAEDSSPDTDTDSSRSPSSSIASTETPLIGRPPKPKRGGSRRNRSSVCQSWIAIVCALGVALVWITVSILDVKGVSVDHPKLTMRLMKLMHIYVFFIIAQTHYVLDDHLCQHKGHPLYKILVSQNTIASRITYATAIAFFIGVCFKKWLFAGVMAWIAPSVLGYWLSSLQRFLTPVHEDD
ncbi:hypothetical protein BJ878DRAFT_479312 [Calycina marina]|uniref:Uncharacterized protein n=1 Tax=Calycina marina TaxID=1763456 RepID=A0A9P7Z4U9_9HELO|nr:hypothetical protein BJ878DRAFT_479312 [Calycina marina]